MDLPYRAIEVAQPLLNNGEELIAQNNQLQRESIYLQAQVQKLRALEAENHELRELLQSSSHVKESFSEGRLIHTNIDPFSQQILLNKGKVHHIEVGQPVIDKTGLVGLVLGVNEYTSRVLLLTDPSFAVPIQSVRSGERAIATGSGAGELRLNYVTRTGDFIEGDTLVTSGLGGRFPAGYPVGTISSIQHDPSTRFTLIGVTPTAKLGQLRHVLFVKMAIETKEPVLAKNELENTVPVPVQPTVPAQAAVPAQTAVPAQVALTEEAPPKATVSEQPVVQEQVASTEETPLPPPDAVEETE